MGGITKKPTTEKATRNIRAPIKIFFVVELDLNCLSFAATGIVLYFIIGLLPCKGARLLDTFFLEEQCLFHNVIEDCNKAIELNTKYDWAYINSGIAYAELGNREQALNKTVSQKTRG